MYELKGENGEVIDIEKVVVEDIFKIVLLLMELISDYMLIVINLDN